MRERGHSFIGIYMCSGLYMYRERFIIALVYSYKLTILNGVSLITYISEEFTPFTGSFRWGVHLSLVSMCAMVSILFLNFDCFKWGRGVICLWYLCVASVSIYSYKLTVSNGSL